MVKSPIKGIDMQLPMMAPIVSNPKELFEKWQVFPSSSLSAGQSIVEEELFREGLNEKKRFLSGIARMRGEGVYPSPNFSALFQEVHFWSIKRVYFFKNANVLNF